MFTVIPAGSGSTEQQVPGAVALYFERGLSDEDSSWLEFIRVGFSGEAEDTLEFYEAGGEDDRYRRGWSTSGVLFLCHLVFLKYADDIRRTYSF